MRSSILLYRRNAAGGLGGVDLQVLIRGPDQPPRRPWPSFGSPRPSLRVYEADMVEDRRAAPRQEAYVTAALETSQGRSTIAITHDVSAQGLLILTRLELAVGE